MPQSTLLHFELHCPWLLPILLDSNNACKSLSRSSWTLRGCMPCNTRHPASPGIPGARQGSPVGLMGLGLLGIGVGGLGFGLGGLGAGLGGLGTGLGGGLARTNGGGELSWGACAILQAAVEAAD